MYSISLLQLIIKPQSEDGLILFSGKNDLGDFIAVYLNFGEIQKQFTSQSF
jgi:hypothetical protein